TLSGVPVTISSSNPPTNDSGATSSTTSGSTNDSNCTSITAQTLTTASPSTSNSAWNASCWLAYWPPSATRTPGGGMRGQHAAHVAHHAAQRAAAHVGREGDHLLLVLALEARPR